MVTNQLMKREIEIEIGKFKVLQRTSDGYFNATALLDQWNENPSSPSVIKQMEKFMALDSTYELKEEIKKREGKTVFPESSINSKFQVVIHSKAKTGQKGGRPKDNVYMHPILFIDFAMWLNPRFKYDVIKFCYDKMIDYRKDSGDAYKALGEAVAKIVQKEAIHACMGKIGEALNWIVFNNHYPNIRNDHGTEKEMKELFMLEQKLADLINDGFLMNFDSVINFLRRQYEKKQPKVFLLNK